MADGRHRLTRQRVRDVAVLAGAAVVVLLAGNAVLGSSPTAVQVSEPTPTPADEPVKALFFGDSITEGCCRTDPTAPRMGEVAREELGWRADLRGAGGTGYLNAGPEDLGRVPYGERIQPAVAAADYDVVVLQGSGNDAGIGTEQELVAAVRDVLEKVRREDPASKIVLVGPYAPEDRPYERERAVLRGQAEALGLPFIDPVAEGWMDDRRDLLAADAFHPNDDGHRYLGQRLAAALRAALPSPPSP